jgi:cbb3-type cytochrome oxidase maturation protein
MDALLILIPIALLLSLMGLAAFFWALKHKQFEDIEGSSVRILDDDYEPDYENKNSSSPQ